MSFTVPWHALFGGILLGLSAGILLLFSGKIAGISGIIAGVLKPQPHEFVWKAIFLISMILSLVIVQPFDFSLPSLGEHNLLIVALGGLLVGFGTRLGNGCTSGHGIIGMGRFSKRSIVATCTFMISAIVIVYIRRRLGVI